MTRSIRSVLTIAGSDSGGGAGIQADLRTFSFHCIHGASAITCVTAQNTVGVEQVEALSPAIVAAQIEAVVKDIEVQALKTGMLLNADIIDAVAKEIEKWSLNLLVVDPVMVSRTGAPLIDQAAIAELRQTLIPKALIVTPNRYEAQLLSGREIHTLDDMREAAQRIYQLGSAAVLVKGGAMPGQLKAVDVWFDGERWEILRTPAVETDNTHGTGCTLSAAISANLALGAEPLAAVKQAKHYVTNALQHSLAIGKGSGPIGHFFPLLKN